MKEHILNNQMQKLVDLLNPKNILIDDRSIKDLVNYLNNLSNVINYHNSDNKVDDVFSSMINTNESFLVAQIASFDLKNISSKRLILIKEFDNARSFKEKYKVFINYIFLLEDLFILLDDWFEKSRKNNFTSSNESIEENLEKLIKLDVCKLLDDYNSLLNILYERKIILEKRNFSNNRFKSIIWKYKSNKKINENLLFPKEKNDIILISFKKVELILNSVYRIIYNIIEQSDLKFNNYLEKSNNHNPHVGLLFSFLHLFKNLQNDLNKISEKHLRYYYENILNQKKKKIDKLKTFVSVDINENINSVIIKKDSELIAGQYNDGNNIIFKTDDDTVLNNVKICFLMTIFLSRNVKFDYGSRFKLVSSVFSQIIANNQNEVVQFNKNENVFDILGKDQNFLIDDDRTMQYADVGFMISSPSLRLSESHRTVKIDFYFEQKSIQNLSDLIIDISNNTQLNEEEVFYKIFSDSLVVKYSSVNGWNQVENYKFIYPDDWSKNKLTISIKFNKLLPALFPYDETVHKKNIKSTHPIIEFILNQNSFYNSYSFLSRMRLTKIDIKTSVRDLKQIKAFRESQLLPINSEFELFGVVPKIGSKLYISCEELFNKKIESFEICWDYSNLIDIDNDFKNYYLNYNLDIDYDNFKFSLATLSDFKYNIYKMDNEKNHFNLFNTIDNKLIHSLKFNIIDIDNLNILPNYKLNINDINEFSNDLETGLIKFELVSPKFAFGHKIYPKIHSASLTNSLNVDSYEHYINEPFSPKISNISINYNSKTSLIFKESERNENDFDEENKFFLISPYGIENTFSKQEIKNNFLYELKNEGELIMGFESKTKLKNLDILFEIQKGEYSDYSFSREINWFYSTYNGWKKLEEKNVLFDQTNCLVKTGIISFTFPADISSNHSFFSQDNFYLKATSRTKADQFGLIKSIKTNSIAVTKLDSVTQKPISYIKSGSIQKFNNNIKGVVSVNQSISSPNVNVVEKDIEFFKRISDLLKHKNRPITKIDYELLLLNKFNWLSHVKCFDNKDENVLSILCFKKIENFQNIDEINLTLSEINELKQFLITYSTPFIDFDILNPVFEDLWIKCKIIFKNISPGLGIEKVTSDLSKFVCPWRFSNNKISSFDHKIKKIDILNFIKSRDYVDFVTGFSIIHLKQNSNGVISVVDTALNDLENEYIEPGFSRSVIIPRNHQISIIKDEEYFKAEPTNFNELEINNSFLVSDNQIIENKNSSNKKKSEEFDNLQFIIKF
jgi:hypothetical protein